MVLASFLLKHPRLFRLAPLSDYDGLESPSLLLSLLVEESSVLLLVLLLLLISSLLLFVLLFRSLLDRCFEDLGSRPVLRPTICCGEMFGGSSSVLGHFLSEDTSRGVAYRKDAMASLPQ